MNRSAVQIIWKLVVVSLFVGLALDYFDVSPVDLIHDIPQAVSRIFDAAYRVIEWGGKYVLLGAIVVVPVWVLMNITSLKDKFKGKNKS